MRRLLIMMILIAMTSACAKRARVQLPGPIPNPGVVMASSEGAAVDGRASYYGDPYHGRSTANGETFDKNKMTAAHRTLPFNTWVRVENQLNGRKVDVRINDRGPFVGGRLIDLSEGAAHYFFLPDSLARHNYKSASQCLDAFENLHRSY